MALKLAINGYGRIGRMVLRAWQERFADKDIEIVAINDLGNPDLPAHLTTYDSIHGPFPGTVELAEISGSDTFVHVHTGVGEVVAQLTGVHDFELGSPITLHLNPAQVYVFDQSGDLLVAPERKGASQ